MNKIIKSSLLAVLFACAPAAFAQWGNNLVKTGLEGGLERNFLRQVETKVLQNSASAAAGKELGGAAARAAQHATAPAALNAVSSVGMLGKEPTGVGRVVLAASSREGLKILRDNQNKFAIRRARNTYETAWSEMPKDKVFENQHALAAAVYSFYTKNNPVNISELPRARTLSGREGVIYELPVNGLKLANGATNMAVSAEKFAVFAAEDFQMLVLRRVLEEGYSFVLIK